MRSHALPNDNDDGLYSIFIVELRTSKQHEASGASRFVFVQSTKPMLGYMSNVEGGAAFLTELGLVMKKFPRTSAYVLGIRVCGVFVQRPSHPTTMLICGTLT